MSALHWTRLKPVQIACLNVFIMYEPFAAASEVGIVFFHLIALLSPLSYAVFSVAAITATNIADKKQIIIATFLFSA